MLDIFFSFSTISLVKLIVKVIKNQNIVLKKSLANSMLVATRN